MERKLTYRERFMLGLIDWLTDRCNAISQKKWDKFYKAS